VTLPVFNSSSVRLFDVEKRRESPLITRLTSAIDVLPLRSGIYVLEHSENVFAGLPTGRLLKFATPSSAPQVIASGLNHPTSMVYSARHRAFFVTELNANRISRIDH
jgi:hypothetical protein